MKALMVAIACCLVAAPTGAAEVGAHTVLDLPGDAQMRAATYKCDGIDSPLSVQYVNADPNYLAIVPVNGDRLVFVSVIAADGARYASGPYQWWSKGSQASLTDLRDGNNAKPVSCVAVSDSP